MKLIPLPAFQDNYLWVLHDGQRALVVDPGDAQPVLAFLRQAGLHLEAILVTHHHHAAPVGRIANFLPAHACNGAANELAYTLANPRFAHIAEPRVVGLTQYPAQQLSLCTNG